MRQIGCQEAPIPSIFGIIHVCRDEKVHANYLLEVLVQVILVFIPEDVGCCEDQGYGLAVEKEALPPPFSQDSRFTALAVHQVLLLTNLHA